MRDPITLEIAKGFLVKLSFTLRHTNSTGGKRDDSQHVKTVKKYKKAKND